MAQPSKKMKRHFQDVRILCDRIWEQRCVEPNLPEFDLANVKKLNGVLSEPNNIWVHSKDGEAHVGDMAVMGTLAPILRANNITLTCISNPSLSPLFDKLRDVFTVIPYTLPEADILESLSGVTHHSNWSRMMDRVKAKLAGDHSNPLPYLACDEGQVSAFRERYAENGLPVIGIVWRTSLIGRKAVRDSSLDEWKPVIEGIPANFVSLQYGDMRGIRYDISMAEENWGARIALDESVDSVADLPTYAAQIKACDFVVTIDCSTVFLAGGLGVQTRTMIPTQHSPRWGDERTLCPFFPETNKIFRQEDAGVWDVPLRNVQNDLMNSLRHLRN